MQKMNPRIPRVAKLHPPMAPHRAKKPVEVIPGPTPDKQFFKLLLDLVRPGLRTNVGQDFLVETNKDDTLNRATFAFGANQENTVIVERDKSSGLIRIKFLLSEMVGDLADVIISTFTFAVNRARKQFDKSKYDITEQEHVISFA